MGMLASSQIRHYLDVVEMRNHDTSELAQEGHMYVAQELKVQRCGKSVRGFSSYNQHIPERV